MYWLGLLLVALMGLSLGLLGGGGSILAVPILEYVFGMEAHAAIAGSLVLVGSTALLSCLMHHRTTPVDWGSALVFAAIGAPLSLLGGWLSRRVPGSVLMLLFGLLMLVVGAAMLRRRSDPPANARRQTPALVLSGVAVGFLTGFLGIGGGFLIVPALVLFLGVPMKRAVGTSLLVIALNAGVALLMHRHELHLDTMSLGPMSAAALAGTLAGVATSRWIHPKRLRGLFAVFVILVGLWMVARQALAYLRTRDTPSPAVAATACPPSPVR